MSEELGIIYINCSAMAELFIELYFLGRLSGKKVKLIPSIVFVLLGLIWVTLFSASLVMKFFGVFLLLCIWGFFICKSEYKSCILYSMLLMEIMALCYGVFNSVTGIISPYVFSAKLTGLSPFFMIVNNLLALGLAYGCCFIICRYLITERAEKNQYVLMITAPLLLIFLMSEYINQKLYSNSIVLDENGVMGAVNHGQMLAMNILGLFSIFSIIFAYNKLLLSFYACARISMLEQETRFQRQYVEEARLRYDKTRGFRHDIKNHFSVIKGLLENGLTDKAVDYINSVNSMSGEFSFSCRTNNPVLDIVIGNKMGIAEGLGIRVSCSLKVPQPCPVDDMDLCIILSNALDNALHECESLDTGLDKHIFISGLCQGDFLLINVENTCKGNKLIKTGTGLSNVKSVAEKYNGSLHLTCRDSVFSFSILLNMG